ncbi:MAG: hypothetical protein B6226_00745 [Candidatus Cloacimonetes bacterium 4572_65]|nr:MAG: hypothetical protein B6226_00745 [Candidatus Cloacimonetes bacterium 4572_65]
MEKQHLNKGIDTLTIFDINTDEQPTTDLLTTRFSSAIKYFDERIKRVLRIALEDTVGDSAETLNI